MALIAAVIDRLRAAPGGALTSVGAAEDLEAIAKGTQLPAGATFVVPVRETAGPNATATGGWRQTVEVELMVAVVIRRADDPRGARRLAMVDDVAATIEAALVGWSPDPVIHDLFEFATAGTTPAGPGVSWYAQTYLTTRQITR